MADLSPLLLRRGYTLQRRCLQAAETIATSQAVTSESIGDPRNRHAWRTPSLHDFHHKPKWKVRQALDATASFHQLSLTKFPFGCKLPSVPLFCKCAPSLFILTAQSKESAVAFGPLCAVVWFCPRQVVLSTPPWPSWLTPLYFHSFYIQIPYVRSNVQCLSFSIWLIC